MIGQLVISQDNPVPSISPGIADIVGFGVSGVEVLRNSFKSQIRHVCKNFGQLAGGWTIEKHVRVLADTTGDGYKDIVGFGDGGVMVAINNGNNTFRDAQLVVSNFSYNVGGWRVDKHPRFMADLRKTGRADIVGFADAGVMVSFNIGNGLFAAPKLVIAKFGYQNGGWRTDRHLRFLADVTGNGFPDVVGFGEHFVFVALNNGDGTFQPAKAVLKAFCVGADSGGWSISQHPRFLADLTGDGKSDIVGFASSGVFVSLNNGNGSFQPAKLVSTTFGYTAGGWTIEKHPRFIVDLTGDGRGDIIGFGEAETFVAFNKGDGTFAEATKVPNLNYLTHSGGGWKVDKHPRFFADMTGDGCADAIGFGEKEVFVSYNDGKGNFGPSHTLTTDFAYNEGQWSMDKTIRYVTNLKV